MKNWQIVLTTVLIGLIGVPAQATDTYWQVGTGNWSTGPNWDNGEPTANWGDNAYINNGGTAQITQAGELCYYLYLGEAIGESGSVELSGDGQLSARHEHIGYSGTGAFTQTGGTNTLSGHLLSSNLYLGYNSSGNGTYELSGDGQLSAVNEHIGRAGTGAFTQTGGTNTISGNLLLASESSGNGTYELSGTGQLSAYDEHIGWSGTGTFTQTGGTNTIGNRLLFGVQSAGNGTYELSGTGQLSADEESIGYGGTGTFTQTGGTNTNITFLDLGYYSGSNGTYELSGTGQLSAFQEIIGRNGTGTFTQTGGANTGITFLYLGYYSGSNGTYELSGDGQLSAVQEYIGRAGTGTFTQTGGTNTISQFLSLGHNSGGNGAYELSGTGQLSPHQEYIGNNGTGTFTQTGGTNAVGSSLIIGQGSGGDGTYTISNGNLSATYVYLGYPGSEGSGTLNIAGSAANVTVSYLLHFGPDSTFTAVPGSTIHMTGSAFENENTDATDLAGLSNLELIFEGGSEDIDPFEVAGEDMGAVINGWADNFVLGTLTLGDVDIGKIQLIDDYDNQPGWLGSEALYVYNLNIGSGSYLNLNGLNLYYRQGSIDPGSTIDYNGGNLIHLLDVDIDIRPGSDQNPLNSNSNGVLPVAIFGDDDLDVYDIDLLSLLLDGASPKQKGGSENVGSFEDVNDDGLTDLLLNFQMSELDIDPSATELVLDGLLNDGTVLFGSDLIRLVGPGDFNGDGLVNGVDFGLWQMGYPTASGASLGDADGDGDVDGVDFGIWQANYPTNLGGAAAIPEPATLGLLLIGGLVYFAGDSDRVKRE